MKMHSTKVLLAILIATMVLGMVLSGCTGTGEDLEVARTRILDDSFQAVYVAGDVLDLTNAKLELTFIDGSIKVINITYDMIVGFDTTTTGEKSMKIVYKDIAATYNYRVVASTIIETPVNFTLTKVIDEKGGYYVEIGICSVAEEKEGVYAFSFELALVGATCGDVQSLVADGFAMKTQKDGGSLKVVAYAEDGYTKYAADGTVCRVALNVKSEKVSATVQSIVVSNGKKDMSVSKVALDIK